MKRGLEKKGLSPVIATILLIFLVLVLAAIFALWARGFLTEQLEKEGESVQTQCTRVKFRAEINKGSSGSNKLILDITNTGNIGIHGINVKYKKNVGYASQTAYINLDAGRSTQANIEIQDSNVNFLDQDEITVYPVLLATVDGGSENKEYTCTDNSQRIRI